jgi:hypothetical protein
MKTVASAFDDARGIVPGHRGRRMTRRGRLHSFLDVDQAEAAFFCLAFSYPEQYRKRSRSRELHPFIEYATMLDMALSRKLARRGIDIDNVRGFEHDAPAIDVHRPDMRRLHKIRRSASGEFAIEFAVDQHSSTGARVLLRGRQIASQGIVRLRVSRPAPKMLASIMLILAAPFAELLEHNSSRSDKERRPQRN